MTLLIGGPWTRQPQVAVPLDSDNAFARLLLRSRGVAESWIFGGGLDLGAVKGGAWTTVGTVTQTATPHGVGSKGDGSSSYRYRTSPVFVSSTMLPVVFVLYVQPSGSGAQTNYGIGSVGGAGAFIQLYSFGTSIGANTRAVDGSGSIITATGPTFTAGQLYAVAFDISSSTGTACTLWVNGVGYAGTGSIEGSGGASLANETVNGLRRDTATNFSAGTVLFSGYVIPPSGMNRTAVLREWTSRPFDIFQHRRTLIPVGVVAGGSSWTVTLTDTASATDSYTPALDALRSVTDAGSATDDYTPSLDTLRALTDTASATDSLTAAVDAVVALLDAASASDLLTAAAVVQAVISDLAGASDTSTATVDATVALTDAASATDTATGSFEAAGTVALSDLASANDSLTCAATLLVTLADSASGTDAYTAAAELVRTLTDTASATDSITASIPGTWDVTLTELAAAVDVIAVAVAGGEVLSAPPLVRRLESSIRIARTSASRSDRLQSRNR